MTNPLPVRVDAEVAAAVFAEHVDRASASAQARSNGWTFTWLDPLHVVATVEATRSTREKDRYYVKLGAEYYDVYPPTTSFVCPPASSSAGGPKGGQWGEARQGSRWFPVLEGLPWFALHDRYPFKITGDPAQVSPGQLVCCSMTLEFYVSDHNPTEGQRWQQGRHTLSATLNRIHDALNSPNYKGPSGADNP